MFMDLAQPRDATCAIVFCALASLTPACGTGALASSGNPDGRDSDAATVTPVLGTFACKCQRACAKAQADQLGSCYGDCANAPAACTAYFDCLLADGGARCSFGCTEGQPCLCGAWYHGGGACVQNWDPPPTGDCPDRCSQTGPACRAGTQLKEGRCVGADGG